MSVAPPSEKEHSVMLFMEVLAALVGVGASTSLSQRCRRDNNYDEASPASHGLRLLSGAVLASTGIVGILWCTLSPPPFSQVRPCTYPSPCPPHTLTHARVACRRLRPSSHVAPLYPTVGTARAGHRACHAAQRPEPLHLPRQRMCVRAPLGLLQGEAPCLDTHRHVCVRAGFWQ